MLRLIEAPATIARIAVRPAREAIVSWNSRVETGSLDLRVERCDGVRSGWLPYVRWDAQARRSLSGADEAARIEIDVVRASSPIAALEVRAVTPLDALYASVPDPQEPGGDVPELFVDVKPRSQYNDAYPAERGWCSPAALAMLLEYWGYPLRTEVVTEHVWDCAYAGAGNWIFNMAFASTLGLRAAVVYLRGLAHAAAFLADGVPLALSFSWRAGELPGAPIETSNGHLAVLVGFDANGDVVLNDPAQPSLRATYQRAAFERAWLDHGGVAYALAPSGHANLLALADD